VPLGRRIDVATPGAFRTPVTSRMHVDAARPNCPRNASIRPNQLPPPAFRRLAVAVSRAVEYRRRAQQCLEMARTFGDHGARVTLAHMAQAWLRVADNCQDAKKVRPPCSSNSRFSPRTIARKTRPPQLVVSEGVYS